MDETPIQDASISPAVELAVSPELARQAVSGAAEAWGADWRPGINGGSLHLPIAAGIRRGSVQGELRIEAAGAGSRVRFLPGEATYHLQTGAVAILVMAAAGGVMTTIWPFFPDLLPLAPLGALIALSGWFLVISRLTTSTPEDFLRLVHELSREEAGEETGGDGDGPNGDQGADSRPDRPDDPSG